MKRAIIINMLFGVFCFAGSVAALAQGASSAPAWNPPVDRPQSITLFAPSPLAGDNIFKGEAEDWLADAAAEYLNPIEDLLVSDYVRKVGGNLGCFSARPDRTYKFTVLDDSEINAWNAGGGRVYVNRGLLEAVESEDELAGILAHEIGHDAFGHSAKTLTRQLFWMTGIRILRSRKDLNEALERLFRKYEENQFAAIGEDLLGFSRFNELEADRAAFYNSYRAGYNPAALTGVFDRFVEEEKKNEGEQHDMIQFIKLFTGSHPPTPQRAAALASEANFVKMPPKEARYRNAAFDAMKARLAKL